MRKRLKAWCWLHKWSSLACTAFMLMLCITGLPLVFHHEIDHLLGYSVEPPPMADAQRRASVETMVADAEARRPEEITQFVVRDPEEPQAWYVRLGETVDAPQLSSFFTYDARSGEFLHAYPVDQGFMNVMLRLHIDLFAGVPGMLFLGFMGLLLLVSLVSGTVLYGPFMRKLAFGTVRKHRAPRTRWLDLHNLLGIVTLVWLFVVGGTGVINTLSEVIFNRWQATELADMTAPYQDRPPLEERVSVDAAIAAARAAEPEMALSFMAFPGNGFASPHHFAAFMQGTTPLTETLLKPVLIDAATAAVVDKRELPWYVTTLLVSQPLHFGDYGGLPLKVLWAALDVLTIVVLGSGLYLWLKRRSDSVEARLRALALEEAADAGALGDGGREQAA